VGRDWFSCRWNKLSSDLLSRHERFANSAPMISVLWKKTIALRNPEPLQNAEQTFE